MRHVLFLIFIIIFYHSIPSALASGQFIYSLSHSSFKTSDVVQINDELSNINFVDPGLVGMSITYLTSFDDDMKDFFLVGPFLGADLGSDSKTQVDVDGSTYTQEGDNISIFQLSAGITSKLFYSTEDFSIYLGLGAGINWLNLERDQILSTFSIDETTEEKTLISEKKVINESYAYGFIYKAKVGISFALPLSLNLFLEGELMNFSPLKYRYNKSIIVPYGGSNVEVQTKGEYSNADLSQTRLTIGLYTSF